MPIFEIETGGKTYEVDAPTQAAALAGFQKFTAPKVGLGEAIGNAWDKPPSGPSLIGFAKGIWEDLIKPPGQAYRGEIDPLSDESIGRSLRAATVATPLSPAAGIFGAASGIGGGVGARNMRQGPPAPSPSGALSPAAQAAVDQARAMGAEVRIGADVLPPVATPVATPAINAAIEAGQRQNIDLPKFLASETETVPRIAAATANVPYAGEPIVTSAKKVVEQIGAGKQAIADELGVGSAEVGGGAAKDALANWISTESQKPVSDAYKTVDSLINPEIRAPLSNTADEVAKIMAERATAKIPGKSKAVETVLEAIQAPEGMNYAGAKGLRSFLGEQTPQELIAQGIKPVEAKRLYGPLTRDLQSIVAASGPEATTAFQQANAITRLTANQRRNLTKIVGAKGDAPAEAVFSRLVAMSGSKSAADIQRLTFSKSFFNVY